MEIENSLETIIALIEKMYGFDFSGYSRTSLQRRFLRLMHLTQCKTVEEFIELIHYQSIDKNTLINEITVNVTEMFRDPEVFQAMISHIFPYFASLSRFKIWSAGCSSGEEAYSLAILLEEARLRQNSLIYGTDIHSELLEKAKAGIYELAPLKLYSSNYQQAGGKYSLSNYYTAKYNSFKINAELQKNVVFAPHNLVSDYSFNEFQLILCRNVLIYFDKTLKNRALQLFIDSLAQGGYLVLGNKESLLFSPIMKKMEVIDAKARIYRKL
ncbi:MAG: CheR family methyltransferase [Bacteroidia bacterium]